MTELYNELVSAGNKLPVVASLLNLNRDPSRTSEKYKSTDDIAVVKQLNDAGWFVSSYKQVKAHDSAKQQFKGYQATYTNQNFPSLNNEGSLTLVQRNSKDGLKPFTFNIGFYRIVCTNGLIVGKDLFTPVHVKHIGDLPGQVKEIVHQATNVLPNVYERVNAMQDRVLTDDEALELASKAAQLRFDDKNTINPFSLLLTRRHADQGNSLWKVFNRVQENLINSNRFFKVTDTNGKKRAARNIKDIELSYKINTNLWGLSESYL